MGRGLGHLSVVSLMTVNNYLCELNITFRTYFLAKKAHVV